MIIEGHCRDCGHSFDAHWNQYPDLSTQDAILFPYCHKCKGIRVTTITDETNDLKQDAWEEKHGRSEEPSKEDN